MRLAPLIDHTLLSPAATQDQIDRLCRQAMAHSFATVCVAGRWVSRAAYLTAESPVGVAAVVNFPLGSMNRYAVEKEAALALADGAEELDMVLPLGDFFSGYKSDVVDSIRSVVQLGAPVKVILETALMSAGQIEEACLLAVQGGAAFVKTSTGFGPGGATAEAVRLMRRSVPDRVGVKASGGIKTREFALELVRAGATRLGCSAGLALIEGDDEE